MRTALITAACFWPGLPQAWLWGHTQALALAAAFGGCLNLALVATFAWPQWPAGLAPGTAATAAWVLVLGLWMVGFIRLRGDWNRLFPSAAGSNEQLNDWFREAQTLYLRGHWVEAEALAARVLHNQNGDVEARLLLASIQRRSGQRQTAAKTLADLPGLPAAAPWRDEIAAELQQLSELESTAAVQPTYDAPRDTYRKAA